MYLKIISLNLKWLRERETRLPKIISFIQEKDPDIVFLQEVDYDPIQGLNTLENLNKELWYTYKKYAKCFNYWEDYGKWILLNKTTNKPDFIDEALGILSKFPFSSSIIDLPIQKGSDRRPRIALQCDFDNFSIVNVHFSASNSALSQREPTPKQDIIIWDFNIKPLQMVEVKWQYNSSYDFKQYVSYPSEWNTFDYCLLKSWKFQKLETFEWLSDHAALYLEIEL